ncbi:MAG: hypothetical protein WA667_22855 [Candidatus Nitrosopolaris sp.]
MVFPNGKKLPEVGNSFPSLSKIFNINGGAVIDVVMNIGNGSKLT